MTKKIQNIIGGTIIGIVLIFMGISATEYEIPLGGRTSGDEQNWSSTYVTTTDTIVYSGPSFLERVIIWADTTSGSLTVIDGPNTTSTATIIFKLEGDNLAGSYEVGIPFTNKIVVDAVNATTTFIYIPR